MLLSLTPRCLYQSRFAEFEVTCLTDQAEIESFGVDPAFVVTSSLYDAGAVRAGVGNTTSTNEQGTPFGFEYVKADFDDKNSGFPVLFDINLSRAQAQRLLQYLKVRVWGAIRCSEIVNVVPTVHAAALTPFRMASFSTLTRRPSSSKL